jgi:hypothetical protein
MKKYNVKIFNKHKLNAVGADASVRLEKNQNKNYIRTFEKLKLNVVGVGVPDDPFIKQKHINKSTSNIQTSNIKFPTSNAAITLIALIITIIVLLILAGVTLNMVMGESGLFGKANNAKSKTEVAQYEEELRMCVLELQTEEASNGRTFNMNTIKNNLDTYTQKLEDETIEWKEKDIEEPTGIYKGYNFYIDKKYGAHIKDKATGTQISMKILSEIPETGYTNQDVSLKITITNNEKGINKIIKPDGNTENLNGAKTYEEEKTATENTKYTYVVTDTEGKEETKEVEIKIIDKNAPQDFSIEAQVTEEGIQITATPEDAEETEKNASSGINKVEYYVKKDTETEFTNKGTKNIIKELPSGTYSVYAKAYDKAGNEKQSTNTVTGLKVSAIYKNITAKMVAEHPKLYYGLTVTNYESQNGQNDWKIFYSDWNENPDDAHIFLITGDCVDLSVDGRLNENTKMTMISKYIADWKQKDIPDEMQLVPDETLELFKATEYKLKSKNQNSICVSTLLNSENWQGYLDTNNEKAKEAIGGPTIEMWSLSWNSKYPSDKIYYKADKEGYGYFIGENEDPIKNYSVNNSQKKGYNDVLYNVSLVNSNTKNRIYWISSPSADEDVRLYYNIVGNIASNRNTVNAVGIRPVVSLNKDVTVDAKDSE